MKDPETPFNAESHENGLFILFWWGFHATQKKFLTGIKMKLIKISSCILFTSHSVSWDASFKILPPVDKEKRGPSLVSSCTILLHHLRWNCSLYPPRCNLGISARSERSSFPNDSTFCIVPEPTWCISQGISLILLVKGIGRNQVLWGSYNSFFSI